MCRKSFLASIARMEWPVHIVSDWHQRVPRWSAALLAGALAADLGHAAWAFRTLPVSQVTPSAAIVSAEPRPGVNVRQIVDAHLFGSNAIAPTVDAAHAPETQLPLALSGIIATAHASQGYAILGEKGKPSHLYYAGASLSDVAQGRLYQVFADHVVLDLNGRLETLRLPRQTMLTNVPAPIQVAAAAPDPAAASQSSDDVQFKPPRDPTVAESWFGNLRVTTNNFQGQLHGLRLHPIKRFEREFDLREGDIVTAVNGVEVTDPDVLQDLLKTYPKSLSLTFTRAGVQQSLTVPLQQ
jgi:general secretion pathway protein C